MRRTGCRSRRWYAPNPRWNGARSERPEAEAGCATVGASADGATAGVSLDVAETGSGTAVVAMGVVTEPASAAFVDVGCTGAAEANTRASRKFRSGGYAAVCAEDQPEAIFCPPAMDTWDRCSQRKSASERRSGASPGETSNVVYFCASAPKAHCGNVISWNGDLFGWRVRRARAKGGHDASPESRAARRRRVVRRISSFASASSRACDSGMFGRPMTWSRSRTGGGPPSGADGEV
eukprot:5469425-Pleurochrysis_carterae.AAC.1